MRAARLPSPVIFAFSARARFSRYLKSKSASTCNGVRCPGSSLWSVRLKQNAFACYANAYRPSKLLTGDWWMNWRMMGRVSNTRRRWRGRPWKCRPLPCGWSKKRSMRLPTPSIEFLLTQMRTKVSCPAPLTNHSQRAARLHNAIRISRGRLRTPTAPEGRSHGLLDRVL